MYPKKEAEDSRKCEHHGGDSCSNSGRTTAQHYRLGHVDSSQRIRNSCSLCGRLRTSAYDARLAPRGWIRLLV